MKTLEEYRPTWAEINLDNLVHNLNEVKKLIDKKTEIMAVVKADAYGHGAVEVSKALLDEGITKFAVATLSEAIELRDSGIDKDILILGYTPLEQLNHVVAYNIIQTVYDYQTAYEMSSIAQSMNKTCRVHIKIDTGMCRLGFGTSDEMVKSILKISKLSNVFIEGIFSHFATADESDKEFAKKQYNEYINLVERLKANDLDIPIRHMSNSAGIIDLPEYNLNVVRAGIMLYGLLPSKDVKIQNINLKPTMTLKTRISNIRIVPKGVPISYNRRYVTDKITTVATVPIGYADGFSRILTDKAYMSVDGQKVKVIGNICMDQCMLDVTGIEDIYIGKEVEVFGSNKNVNSVDDLARELETINYEIICMVSRRVPRVYKKGTNIVKVVNYLRRN